MKKETSLPIIVLASLLAVIGVCMGICLSNDTARIEEESTIDCSIEDCSVEIPSVEYATKDVNTLKKANIIIINAAAEDVQTVAPVVCTDDTGKITILKGDANMDGEVTLLDVRLILRAAVKLTDLGFGARNADIDEDGRITAIDARMALTLYQEATGNKVTITKREPTTAPTTVPETTTKTKAPVDKKVPYVTNITSSEREILAKLLYCESGSTSWECQVWTCSAILNLSDHTGQSIARMASNRNMFSVAPWVWNARPTQTQYKVIDYVLSGGRIADIKYFRTSYPHNTFKCTFVRSIDNVYFSK